MKDWTKEFTSEEIEQLIARYKSKEYSTQKRKHGELEFSLTLDDWFMMGQKLLGRGRCDYTNMTFNMTKGKNGQPNPRYPSVERIDDTKGYIRGNVCVVLHKANLLKDYLVTRKSNFNIEDSLDKEIIRAMILNMSKEHMESLKTKYIPQEESEMSVKENLDKMGAVLITTKNPDGSSTSRIVKREEDTPEQPEEQQAEIKTELPEDVVVALAYTKYMQDLHNAGMKVSATYAQFKAKYIRNTCALTGEKISNDQKAVLVLDLELGLAKDNFVIVSGKMQKAMTDMMIATGLSLPQVFAMLKKVI